MTWYDVTGVFAGALDEQRFCPDEDEKDKAIEEIEKLYRAHDPRDTDWAWGIYVVPHECDPDSEDECVCVQYLQDHNPIRKGGTVT